MPVSLEYMAINFVMLSQIKTERYIVVKEGVRREAYRAGAFNLVKKSGHLVGLSMQIFDVWVYNGRRCRGRSAKTKVSSSQSRSTAAQRDRGWQSRVFIRSIEATEQAGTTKQMDQWVNAS